MSGLDLQAEQTGRSLARHPVFGAGFGAALHRVVEVGGGLLGGVRSRSAISSSLHSMC
jgi:hypothetical protein